MRLTRLIFFSILITINSSKCPESRKPHSTSCIIFYKCINLPDGGYVWVPSKCTNGLIFQPYLQMCVLPGDSWTCDILSTESSIITDKYDQPELINPNETSYMGLTEDPSNFSELIDSSYTTDSIPGNQEMITPYPLIEFDEKMENRHEQYDYSQRKNHTGKEYSMLSRLIRHLLLYREITIPLEILASMSLPTLSRTNTSTSTSTSDILSKEPEFSKTSQPSVLMNYLIQNYVQQNNLQTVTATVTKLQTATEAGKILNEDNTNESMSNVEAAPNDTLQTLVDDSETENSIILITDNAGNKQYLTTEKYKSLGYDINSQFIRIIPCVKNVRMPNATNCVKYYVCEPEMLSLIEYSCPSYTAFNKYTRVCDKESYNKCLEMNRQNVKLLEVAANSSQINMLENNICTEHGKTRDVVSESHYYICYSSSDNLQNFKSIRMMCPNGLIFCQSKKVCTTKRLCKAN
ncbi:uncharacterized protein LOC128878382 [Hylaeus volcanicus]|uniref:uncharacterized protein LOC128878382 n=1 Tax=Hylaeus volcanicus TaxID=313075 RepID=UPI0023B7FCEB|nr:uncharacterized protein LOC128878382 [Hylaeus volcanicus]